MSKIIFVCCILFIKPLAVLAQGIDIKFIKQSAEQNDYLLFRYYDKFGDCKILDLRNIDKQTSEYHIKNDIPSVILFGSNNTILQPVICLNNNITVRQISGKYFFESSNNNNALLLEQLDNKTSFTNKHLFLEQDDSPIALFHNKANKGTEIFKNARYIHKEQLEFIKQFTDSSKVDDINLNVLKQILEDYYLLSCVFRLMHFDKDSLILGVNEQNEFIKIKEKIIKRLERKGENTLYGRSLVYLYNAQLCEKQFGTEHEFQSQWDTAQSIFNNESKDFLQFILLKKYIGKNINTYDTCFKQFMNNCRDEDYKQYLTNLDEESKKNGLIDFSNNDSTYFLLDTLNNKTTLEDIINKHKGQIMLLDFWASWCVPCRKEMVLYTDMESDLTNNSVKTIFISIDEKKDSWKLAIPKTNTLNYEHYWIVTNENPLIELFNIKSIPRYVLIDKEGKIFDAYAPRPSEKELFLKVIKAMK